MTKSHSSETMPTPSDTLPGGMLLLHGLGMLKMKHVGCSRMAFDGCCPDWMLPGDDCPLIWGACNHAFHLHCILKWVTSQTPQTHCLMCHKEWQFKGGDQTD